MSDGLVTAYVNSASTLIGSVNESGFKSVLMGVNSIAIATATIALVVAIFNQFLQIGYMSPNKMLGLMIKIILIAYLGMRWDNFNTIATAIQGGMDSIANSLLETITSRTQGGASLSGSIDTIVSSMATASNKALVHANWLAGAFLTIVVVVLLALMGAVAALVIIYSKIMISIFIMMAPVFICCLIFEKTADYFYRWLQGAITYALYPVITAAVMALIAGITSSYIDSIKSNVINTVSEFIPFITVIVIAIVVIMFIPIIVSGLSGMIQHVSPLHIAGPIRQVLKTKEKIDPENRNSDNQGYRTPPLSPSVENDLPATKPSGPFPGEPARMFAREEQLRKKD